MGIHESLINRLTFEPTLGAVLLPCLEFADVRLKSCILLLPILVLLVRRAAEDAVDWLAVERESRVNASSCVNAGGTLNEATSPERIPVSPDEEGL